MTHYLGSNMYSFQILTNRIQSFTKKLPLCGNDSLLLANISKLYDAYGFNRVYHCDILNSSIIVIYYILLQSFAQDFALLETTRYLIAIFTYSLKAYRKHGAVPFFLRRCI